MANAIVILILLGIAGFNIWYLIRRKRQGDKCVGCPYAKQCSKKHTGSCENKCDKK